MSIEQMDAVFSFVPEMALPKITLGSTCSDSESAQRLTVLGHYSEMNDSHHFPVFQPTFPVFTPAYNFKEVTCIAIDDASATLVNKKLADVKPLVDGKEENCELLARNSLVLHDA